jgi:hypothetical protein
MIDSVTSINDHITKEQWPILDVRASGMWFTIRYDAGNQLVEVSYNDQGREVFRVWRKPLLWRIWKRIKHAASVFTAPVRPLW